MKSIASAPGKVILFGEHFVVHGIQAVLGAIDKRVTVTSSKRDDEIIYIESNLGKLEVPNTILIENVDKKFRPFVYITKKIIEKFGSQGISIKIDSEIPSGVGLGSSSACCVAATASILNLFEKSSLDQILQTSIDAEKTIFPNTSGADCNVCTYGGIITYDKANGLKSFDEKFNLDMIIINSNLEHSTDQVVNRVKNFKEKNPEIFQSLCDEETKLVKKSIESLRCNDMITLGKCMSQNQIYLEQIGVSNDKLLSIIESIERTSLGIKITGAGDGGCLIMLIDPKLKQSAINDLETNSYEYFSVRIDHDGVQIFN